MGSPADRVRPIRDQVFVQVLQEDLQLPSGLYVPENVKHPSCQGRIVACGPDVTAVDPEIMPGQHVLFEHYQEEQVFPDPTDPSQEYLLMPASDIMVVFEEG